MFCCFCQQSLRLCWALLWFASLRFCFGFIYSFVSFPHNLLSEQHAPKRWPSQENQSDATRRDDGPNRYDVMPELPCFAAAFRFGFVLTLFFSVSVVVFYVFVSFSISFNTFAVVAGIQHVSDFGQSKKKMNQRAAMNMISLHKQSILLCTHRADQVTPHKTGSPPLCTSLLFPLLFLPLVCLVHSLLVLWHSLFEN